MQTREIVLHDLIKSMRNQNVVHVAQHVADIQVPSLHVLVEAEVFHRNVIEVSFQLQVSRFPMLGIFDALFRGAEPCVLEHERDDPAQEVLFFANRSLVDGIQLGHA
jgi:hypothetical protein